MGLKIKYFYSLTPRQFFNIHKGWDESRDAAQKERMILTRRLMFASLAPYSKAKEEEIWPFIWDAENHTGEPTDPPTEDEIEASKKRWQERDRKRALKKE